MKPIYLSIFVLFVSGCTYVIEPDPVDVEDNPPLYLVIILGQGFTFGITDIANPIGTDIELRLAGIPEDSRCLFDVVCDSLGRVVLDLEVEGLATIRTDFQLIHGNSAVSPWLDTLGYRFTLVDLRPIWNMSEGIPDELYSVTMMIEAVAAQ